MKNLLTTARNIRYFLHENKELIPEIELVLTVSDKSVEYVGSGLASTERCETIRFAVSIDGARKFADILNEWAEEAEDQLELIKVAESEKG